MNGRAKLAVEGIRDDRAKAAELVRSIPNQSWDDELSTQILLQEARALIEGEAAPSK